MQRNTQSPDGSRVCLWCEDNLANSREHLIARKRVVEISINKAPSDKNDNKRKKFSGITCKDCNSKTLNRYEQLGDVELSYATIWKLLAGNYNDVFTGQEHDCYRVQHVSKTTLKGHADNLKSLILNRQVLINSTFCFHINLQNTTVKNDTFSSVWSSPTIRDAEGAPLEGVSVWVGGNSENDNAAFATTDVNGLAHLSIPRIVAGIRVLSYPIQLLNTTAGEIKTISVDVVVYLEFRSELGRVMTLLPLLDYTNIPWPQESIRLLDIDIISLVDKAFPEMAINQITPYFPRSDIS